MTPKPKHPSEIKPPSTNIGIYEGHGGSCPDRIQAARDILHAVLLGVMGAMIVLIIAGLLAWALS